MSDAAGQKAADIIKKETSDFSFFLPQGRGGAEKRKGIDKNILPAALREK
jgi:hypothetical protein